MLRWKNALRILILPKSWGCNHFGQEVELLYKQTFHLWRTIRALLHYSYYGLATTQDKWLKYSLRNWSLHVHNMPFTLPYKTCFPDFLVNLQFGAPRWWWPYRSELTKLNVMIETNKQQKTIESTDNQLTMYQSNSGILKQLIIHSFLMSGDFFNIKHSLWLRKPKPCLLFSFKLITSTSAVLR